MLKRRWMALFLVLLLVTIGGVWQALKPSPPALPNYPVIPVSGDAYQPGGETCRVTPQTKLTGRKLRDCIEKQEQYRLEANDLVQQTRAADAASAAARLSYNQSIIMLIGTIFSVLTLGAAVAAAFFAGRASTAAEQTLDAQRIANSPVILPFVSFSNGAEGSGVRVSVSNSGNSAADEINGSLNLNALIDSKTIWSAHNLTIDTFTEHAYPNRQVSKLIDVDISQIIDKLTVLPHDCPHRVGYPFVNVNGFIAITYRDIFNVYHEAHYAINGGFDTVVMFLEEFSAGFGVQEISTTKIKKPSL